MVKKLRVKVVKKLRIYGAWAGNPKGITEDTSRCIEEVWPRNHGWVPHQCQRPRGHGPDGLYCKQHARKEEERLAYIAAKDADRETIGDDVDFGLEDIGNK